MGGFGGIGLVGPDGFWDMFMWQGGPVGHRNDVGTVGDLMARCVLIAVDGDHFDAEALQGDDHFLAEFAVAEKHDAQGAGGKRGANFHEDS